MNLIYIIIHNFSINIIFQTHSPSNNPDWIMLMYTVISLIRIYGRRNNKLEITKTEKTFGQLYNYTIKR